MKAYASEPLPLHEDQMNLLMEYQEKLDFLERENSKLKSVLNNELTIKEQIRNDHEKELNKLMKVFEVLEQEKCEVDYRLNQNKEEINSLQKLLKNKNDQIESMFTDKQGMERTLDDMKNKIKESESLEKKIQEVEGINSMILSEKVRVAGERNSMVLKVSQLEKEKEAIQEKLQAFRKYNNLLFGKKNILGMN
jgi:exonuclease SbcC